MEGLLVLIGTVSGALVGGLSTFLTAWFLQRGHNQKALLLRALKELEAYKALEDAYLDKFSQDRPRKSLKIEMREIATKAGAEFSPLSRPSRLSEHIRELEDSGD